MGNAVGGVHAEKREHQDHLGNQNQVRIQGGPAAHFWGAKTCDGHAISPDKKHHARQHHQRCQDFERGNQNVVQAAESGKGTVGPKQTVDDNLQQLNVDDHKPHVNEDVHDAGHWAGHHFALAERHACHDLPTVSWTVRAVHVLTHQDVATDEAHATGKESRSNGQTRRKKELRNHGFQSLLEEPPSWASSSSAMMFRRRLRSFFENSDFCFLPIRLT